jgi:hypothetical protein
LTAPVDEIVHLLQVDPAAVELELTLVLPPALGFGVRPDLGRDDRLGAARAQRGPEHLLGAAVHRRRIEQPGAGVEQRCDDAIGAWLLSGAEVEHAPGAQPDDRHAESGGEISSLHGSSTTPRLR